MDKMTMFKYRPHWAYPIHAILSLTENCNLACQYCFVNQTPKNMSYEVAKDTVDWLQQNYEFRKKHHIGPIIPGIPRAVYFGGEPILRWDDIIVPLTEYIKSTYNPFGLSITTNCTLLTPERTDYLADNNIGILISMDGDKPTQDKMRPCKNGQSSFDLMIDNVKYVLERFPNVNMRATLDSGNAGELFNNYLFAEKIGFKNCSFVTNKRVPWTEADITTLENEIAKIFDYQIEYFKQETLPPLQMGLVTNGFYNAVEYNARSPEQRDIQIQCHYASCGFGRNYIAVNHEGKVFACQQQITPNSIFEIGSIYDGMNSYKQMELLDTITQNLKKGMTCENPEVCKDCKIIRECQGGFCPAAMADRFPGFNIQPEVTCRYKNAFVKNALRAKEILKDNKFFREYLMKICDPSYARYKERHTPENE